MCPSLNAPRNWDMSKLEDLRPNAAVRGILSPIASITVVGAQRFGSEALELTYKSADLAASRTSCYIATTNRASK